MFRQIQCLDDSGIVFSRFRVHHPACGGVCILVAFRTAKAVHQVFRNHQEIGDALKPSGQFVGIQLIDGVEGLKLDAGIPVQACKADFFMHLRD